MRIDRYLAENGFCESRTRAQKLIEEKRVKIGGTLCQKPSEEVSDGQNVTVLPSLHTEYVSRGGHKLAAALEAFLLDVRGLCAADLGASSGGFCDCLLQRGAAKIYAVDCGSGQLAKKLREDARIVSMENTNARTLDENSFGEKVDLCVMDLSFISQTLIFPAVCRILKPHGIVVSLIKPQFEVGRALVGKNGIVKSEKARLAACGRVCENAAGFGLVSRGVIPSPITGGDGNVEYLCVFDFLPDEK